MEDELVIIFSSVIVLVIILGLTVNGVVSKVLNHRRELREHQLRAASPRADEIADRTDMIEDRLRVLERLATDRGTLLADEIDALRDDRAAQTAAPKRDQELS
jgi:hypothetical protein